MRLTRLVNRIASRDTVVWWVACVVMTGCVERTIRITSDPPGTLVYLNDEEVGRTPVTVPFLFYGTYDVRLEHEGYRPLWTATKAQAPWWEAPGPDLIAEMIPHLQAQQKWHFVLDVIPYADDQAVIDRGKQLRAMINTGQDPSPLNTAP